MPERSPFSVKKGVGAYWRIRSKMTRWITFVRDKMDHFPSEFPLAAENRKELTLFKRLVDQTSYIGEIGLDFSIEGIATKNEQISVLREVLATIKGKKKIVSVHSRNAEIELLDMLCEFEIKNVIFHWYSGSVDLIPSIIERGFYFSINESMCRSKNGQSIIGKIPRDKILTETDAPYTNRTNIRMVLNQLNMSEVDIFYNFNRLLNNIK